MIWRDPPKSWQDRKVKLRPLAFLARRKRPAPAAPEGERAYAVGDVHGRLDLVEQMISLLEADVRSRPARRTHVVFLGDLVDRGPDSRGVIDYLSRWRPSWAQPHFLTGNHEEALLLSLEGDREVMKDWLRYGGRQCLESYGLDPAAIERLPPPEAHALIRAHVPREHVRFIRSFSDSFAFGDYLFVHAGIRPGIPVHAQQTDDLRWIREPFLDHRGSHGCIVVHGHTIVDAPEFRDNRIGLDTGAFRSGRLTALGLEGRRQWLVTAKGAPSQPSASAAAG